MCAWNPRIQEVEGGSEVQGPSLATGEFEVGLGCFRLSQEKGCGSWVCWRIPQFQH